MNSKTDLAIEEDKMIMKAEKEDLAKFLNTVGGKSWIRNIARRNMVLAQGMFTGNSTTFYNEGKRDVALAILKDAQEADPEAYASIIKGIQL